MDIQTIIEIARLLYAKKGSIVKVVFFVTLFSIAVVLLLPKYYKSTFVIIPSQNDDNGFLSSFTDLASIAGVNVGQKPVEQLYPRIITSESVLREVIYRKYYSNTFNQYVNLVEYWKYTDDDSVENFENTYEKLTNELIVEFDNKLNVVKISFSEKEPTIASDVLSEIVKQLDIFLRTKKISYATSQRIWLQHRLSEVENDLRSSEESLKTFRERNRVISSPLLLLIQQRLMRQVEINTVIYGELKKQLELVKIQEIKNIPIVNILDYARPAARKDRPKRAMIVIITFILTGITTVGYTIAKETYKKEFGEINDFLTNIPFIKKYLLK